MTLFASITMITKIFIFLKISPNSLIQFFKKILFCYFLNLFSCTDKMAKAEEGYEI